MLTFKTTDFVKATQGAATLELAAKPPLVAAIAGSLFRRKSPPNAAKDDGSGWEKLADFELDNHPNTLQTSCIGIELDSGTDLAVMFLGVSYVLYPGFQGAKLGVRLRRGTTKVYTSVQTHAGAEGEDVTGALYFRVA